ncbi:MAG: hypothetical protein KIT17_02540 [Rubrivivax sp.]|nr:hypothetical protein [Rubrivivax sp.]
MNEATMSKLLATLDAQIAAAASETVRGELLAKRAGYLARVGSFDEARNAIASLRETFSDGRSPTVSIWIMLAEGLLHTFSEMSDKGADRIMRAHALASVTRDRSLIAATSAWRAFTQSERSEFRGMVRSINDAFANSDSADHEILARLYMIVANARMSVGERASANELYMFSRHHALECGDQAAIDALIYNKAAFALAWLRARMCFGERDSQQLRQLRGELASAKTYQQMAKVSALSNFVYLWEARLHLLAEDYVAAIEGLSRVRTMQPFARYNFHQSLVDLEIAYCHSRQGRSDLITPELQEAIQADLSGLHDDDRLVVAWLRNELVQGLPALGDAQSAAAELTARKDEFTKHCEEIRSAMEGLGAHPHIARPVIAQVRARQ